MDILDQRERDKAAAKMKSLKGFRTPKFSDAFKDNARQKTQAEYFQPMQEVDLSQIKAVPADCIRVLANNLYIAAIHIRDTQAGPVELMSIRSMVAVNTKRLTWGEKQRIKSEVYGPDRVALEVYPSQSEGLENDGVFWMWIQPKGQGIPFTVGANAPKLEPVVSPFETMTDKEAKTVAKKLILPTVIK